MTTESRIQRHEHLSHQVWQLSDEQKANAVKKVAVDASTRLGRKVVSMDLTDGANFCFDDGSWRRLRLPETDPLLRLYVEAGGRAA